MSIEIARTSWMRTIFFFIAASAFATAFASFFAVSFSSFDCASILNVPNFACNASTSPNHKLNLLNITHKHN